MAPLSFLVTVMFTVIILALRFQIIDCCAEFPSEMGFFVWFEEMDTVTSLPSGTSVVFISSSILTDVSLTVSLGNEVMTAVTVLGIQCHTIYNVGSLQIDQ